MMKAEKLEAKACLRALERKRKLAMQLAEAERALKANGRRLYERHGLFGGINEARLQELAMRDLAHDRKVPARDMKEAA